jgi:hypothetical protein
VTLSLEDLLGGNLKLGSKNASITGNYVGLIFEGKFSPIPFLVHNIDPFLPALAR